MVDPIYVLQVLCPTCGKLMTHLSGQDVYMCCKHWVKAEKIRKESKNGDLFTLCKPNLK